MAAVGGLALGVAGAVVGASVGKQKVLTTSRLFALFTYVSGGEVKYLVFAYGPESDQMGSTKQTLRKFIKDFEDGDGYGSAVTIEL